MALGLRETTTAQDWANSATTNEDDLIRKFLEEDASPTPEAAPQAEPAPTTIQPTAGEDITVFSERAGYGNLEEFMQNPANKENIKTTASGIPYVLEGVDYQVKPGVDTDISAAPATEGFDIGGETLNIAGETRTVLGGETEIEGEEPGDLTDRAFEDPSEVGTTTDVVGENVLDFDSKPVAEADIDAGKVTEKQLTTTTLPPEKPILTLGQEITPEFIMRIASETFKPEDPTVKSAYEDYKAEIAKIKFNDESELRKLLDKQQKELTAEIASYQTKIDEVAKEEFKPKLKGWNKFFAVLGAAMGSYGASMTGSPNFALNILNEAIDRDAQEFADSKEMRVKNMEQQRLALRERRGQLLTMAERAVDRIQNNAQFQLTTAASQAQIRQTGEQIVNAKEENFRNYLGDLAGILVTNANNKATLDRALTEKERELRVEGVALPNKDGEMVEHGAFLAKTKEQQVELTKLMAYTQEINDDLQLMKKLFDDPKKWVPAVFADTKKDLDYFHNRILLRVKFMNNMGANFTLSEQIMIKAVIPEANVIGRLGVAKRAAELMQRSLFTGVENAMKRQGAIPISMESLYSAKTTKRQKIPTMTKVSDMGK